MSRSWRVRAGLATLLAATGVVLAALPAAADNTANTANTAKMTPVPSASGLRVIVQAKQTNGQPIDLTDPRVRFSGTFAEKTKLTLTPVSSSSNRPAAPLTAILVLDASGSMNEPLTAGSGTTRLMAAETAATAYVNQLPAGVQIGLVTFSDTVTTSPLTTDKSAVISRIQAVKVGQNTALFQAAIKAAALLQSQHGGSILLLSDGHDTTGTPAQGQQARAALAKLYVTAVYVGGSAQERAALEDLIGKDNLLPANAAKDLTKNFQTQARTLSESVTLDVQIPPALFSKEDNLAVNVTLPDGSTLSTPELLVSLGEKAAPTATTPPPAAIGPQAVARDSRLSSVTTPVLVTALLVIFGALTVLVATTTGAFSNRDGEQSEVLRRLSVYSVAGREPVRVAVQEQTTRLGDSALTRSAVSLMTQLTRSGGLERSLDGRLEAAGLPLRTAEWMLLHIGCTVAFAVLFLLIAHGWFVGLIIGAVLGFIAPWLFLSVRQSRRESAFLSQLPDTLQLLAGSLQAGYSLPQAMDAVVRESRPPISIEFNRAMVETRLGLPPEDALDGIASRTKSQDFSWIVMAIRIQREVGGNLAELLGTVAETLRERERLRRQVRALSAEGRLSGAILGALPLLFTIYLLLVQRQYLNTLFTDPIGILLLIVGAVLLAIGAVWMSRVVRVKV